LRFKPRTTGADFDCTWFLMDPPLATRFPLEVLDDVGEVNLFAIHSNCGQCLVQHGPRRTHERPPLKIFAITWLFTHHHYLCRLWALAKYSLGCPFIEGTRCAMGSLFPKLNKLRCCTTRSRWTFKIFGHIDFDAHLVTRAVPSIRRHHEVC